MVVSVKAQMAATRAALPSFGNEIDTSCRLTSKPMMHRDLPKACLDFSCGKPILFYKSSRETCLAG